MRIYRQIIVAALLVLFLFGVGYGQDTVLPEVPTFPIPVPWLLYVDTSDKKITFGWDAVNQPEVTGYEMLFYSMERKAFLLRANIPAPQVSIPITFKGGHWIAYIRSVGKNTENTEIYSDWVASIDPETASEGKPFWLYLMPAPPGELVID